jgi:3-oxoadipate enol-lactonase
MWSPQLAEFTKHFTLLRYDARGQGLSTVASGPYSIADMGADILGLLDALGIERVHFCGLSMGGIVGQWLGINAPQRLLRLVLSNTAAKIGSSEIWSQRIDSVQRSGMEAILPAVLKGWFTEDFHREHPEEIQRMAAMLRTNDPAGYAACCAAIRDTDLRPSVASIRAPTLVISGIYDLPTPPSQAAFLTASIDGAQSLELRTAHIANVEEPRLFTEGVLEFLLTGESHG